MRVVPANKYKCSRWVIWGFSARSTFSRDNPNSTGSANSGVVSILMPFNSMPSYLGYRDFPGIETGVKPTVSIRT